MDLRQQAENVAKAGRYGDSMLLHVNPVEMKGLRQSLPITRNPKTGQDEAFLPFLAPLMGSLLGSSLASAGLLGGLGTLAGGALGSGLVTYAQTGDLKKGILAGMTGYGLGKLAQGASAAAQGAQAADAATSAATNAAQVNALGGVDSAAVTGLNPGGGFAIDPSALADPTVAANVAKEVGSNTVQAGIEAARTGATQIGAQAAKDASMAQNLKTAFTNPQGNFAPMQGASALATGAMAPAAYIPAGVGMGGTGVIESQEAFAEMLKKNQEENEERKKRIQEEFEATQLANLQQIGGVPANFQTGGFTSMEDWEEQYRKDNPFPNKNGKAQAMAAEKWRDDFDKAKSSQEQLMFMQSFDPNVFDNGFNQGYGDFFDFGLGDFPIVGGDGFGGPGSIPGNPPVNTPVSQQLGFPGRPNIPGEFFTPGLNPEFGYLTGQISPSFTNPTYNQFTSPFDMAYQGFYAPQYNPSYNINPYASFDPYMASLPFMSIPQYQPPGTPPTPPPSVPPVRPPIDDPIDGPLFPPDDPPINPPIDVPPPITQPGGPGPIGDPGKQPPSDFGPPATGGGSGGLYDPMTDPRIYDLIQDQIDRRVEALGVPAEGFNTVTPRTDAEIQSLIDQSISGLPTPTYNENELIDRLRNQFVSYDRLPDVIPQPSVGANPFDASDIYGQLGELRGQLSSMPTGGGRTDAEIQALIDQSLSGYQPELPDFNPRSDEDIQGLINQSLAGLEQPNFRDDFMSINQRIDDLYNRPQFTPYDPSDLQEQFNTLSNQFGQLQGQFQGMPNFDEFARRSDIVPPNFDDQFMSINRRIDDLSQRPGFDPASLNLPDFSQFALRSDLAPQYDDADLRQQLGQLEGQFQGFQQGLPDFSQFAMQSDIVPQNFDDRFMSIDQQLSDLRAQPGFDDSSILDQLSSLQSGQAGLRQDFGNLQGQFQGFNQFDPSSLNLPDFSQFATQADLANIPQYNDQNILNQLGSLSQQQASFAQDLGNLQGQFGSLPDFSQFATQSQLPSMPDMSQYALQSQLFDPSGLQGQISGLSNRLDSIRPYDDSAILNSLSGLQGQFNNLPDFGQFAMRSDIPSYDFSNFARMSDIPTMPDMSQYALASQIPAMPDMSQYALASQIPTMPNMNNYVTQQNLQSALSPFGGMQNQLNQFGYDIAGLQGQYNALPDFSQYALATQIPDVSNFVTSSGLANTLGPYAFRSEIPQFSTGGSQPYVQQPPVQQFYPNYFNAEGGKTGYQEGGKVEVTEAVMSDPLTIDLISFIQGETDDNSIVETFIEKYGNEMFTAVREMILQQINPGAQTEGQIEGAGNGGMDDDIPMSIGADTSAAAVSQDEYIIPADVVAMAGDGSSDAGANKFDKLLDNIRQEKYGKKEQPKPLKGDLRSYMQ